MRPTPVSWCVPLAALLAVLAVSACQDDPSPLDPGPPVVLRDSVVFRVTSADENGRMRLRWIGSSAGPLDASPEATERPWIGYGRAFRIEWRVWSKDGAVQEYRWRASQLPNARLLPVGPDGAPVWGTSTALDFSNDHPTASLIGEDCPDGEDCPTLWRFDSGSWIFGLRARDEGGRIQDHVLDFEVNYPPESSIVYDRDPGSGEFEAYPRLRIFDEDGSTRSLRVADGDTVSAGAVLSVRMAGFDRVVNGGGEVALGDSFCCDQRLDPRTPEVQYQLRLSLVGEDLRGSPISFKTLYSPVSAADTLGFLTGPFDFEVEVRTRDEHGRDDPTPARMRLVGGFPPRITSLTPGSNDVVLLRHPNAAEPWPQNTVPYTVETDVRLYWDPNRDRFWDVPVTDSFAVLGAIYRFGLRFEARADPREATLAPVRGGRDYAGTARSWVYRYRSEFDPENLVQDGDGWDSLELFEVSPRPGEWDMPESVEIFVPDELWFLPELYDPDGDCLDPERCDMGTQLRRNLGVIELEVQAKSTSPDSSFRLYVGAVRPDEAGGVLELSLAQIGRTSGIARVEFPVLLGLEQDGSDEPVIWPAP